jgi:YD repeat-containing protein
VQDEGNGGTAPVQRISQVDGLGRLTSVCEVTSATQLGSGGTPAACQQDINLTGFLTTYSYDVLGNLLTVNQGTMGQRTFAYDSLSRLLCAANPETGSATCPNPDNGTYTAFTTRYGYDANGNLTSRTRPAPNQTIGTTTVATTYQYDALNRITQKSYSDGVTPNVRFGYDQASVTMGTQQFNITNSIGRLSWECTLSPSPHHS